MLALNQVKVYTGILKMISDKFKGNQAWLGTSS